jgi:hypothetical protein
MSSEKPIQPPRPSGVAIENRRPIGGEQRPSRRPFVMERPAPRPEHFGNYGSQHPTTNIQIQDKNND